MHPDITPDVVQIISYNVKVGNLDEERAEELLQDPVAANAYVNQYA